ncbi:MAG: hypothetical protein CL663_08175 [Bacteroidetes bacterium]|nr:hypothetical protein [Bacteroidota bacterium]|tara:strand:+ start:210 stop:461 length:252 start_codon:yes stop_codon:yes gene_type:complete
MKQLLLTCLKATELVEKKFLFKLSFRERLQLRLHLSVCNICLRYSKQSALLEQGISNLHESSTFTIDSEAYKQQLKEKLHNQI